MIYDWWCLMVYSPVYLQYSSSEYLQYIYISGMHLQYHSFMVPSCSSPVLWVCIISDWPLSPLTPLTGSPVVLQSPESPVLSCISPVCISSDSVPLLCSPVHSGMTLMRMLLVSCSHVFLSISSVLLSISLISLVSPTAYILWMCVPRSIYLQYIALVIK